MTISRFTHISTTKFAWLPVISGNGRYLATNAYDPTYFFDASSKVTAGPLLIDLESGTSHLIAPRQGGVTTDPGARPYGIDGDGSTILFTVSQYEQVALPANSPAPGYYLEETDGSAVRTLSSYASGMVRLSASPVWGGAVLSGDGAHVVLKGTEWDEAGKQVRDGFFQVDLRSGAILKLAIDVGNGVADGISVSADGGRIALRAGGTNFDTMKPYTDVLVYDVASQSTRVVNTNTAGVAANAFTGSAVLSGNGRYVVFTSSATNLSAEYASSPYGVVGAVYVKDLLTGAIVPASTDSYGHGGQIADLGLNAQAISDDGRYVVFQSTYSYGFKELDTLATPAFGPLHHIFVKDMVTGAVALVNSTPETMVLESHGAAISGDGKTIVFQGIQWLDATTPYNQFKTYALPLPTFSPVVANDIVMGAAGPDTQAAALGDDTYVVDDRGDLVIEYADAGDDTIRAPVTYALPANVEALVLTGASPIDGAGNELANTLTGNGAANLLSGGAGDDLIAGGGGADVIDGGAGRDTARFSGKVADYQIAGGDQASVQLRAGGATTLLTAVERLQFDDALVTFETGGTTGQAYRLYQAAFDRTPDPAGLGYWMGQMERGMSLSSVASLFIASDEFRKIFGAEPKNASFVDLLYQHVLHRAADPAGAAYWTDVLDRHATTAVDVLVQFSESPENQAALVGVMKNGIVYQSYGG